MCLQVKGCWQAPEAPPKRTVCHLDHTSNLNSWKRQFERDEQGSKHLVLTKHQRWGQGDLELVVTSQTLIWFQGLRVSSLLMEKHKLKEKTHSDCHKKTHTHAPTRKRTHTHNDLVRNVKLSTSIHYSLLSFCGQGQAASISWAHTFPIPMDCTPQSWKSKQSLPSSGCFCQSFARATRRVTTTLVT